MFLSATWYGVDPMNSVTLEIVLSVKQIVKTKVGYQILKFLLPTDKITRSCEWASGYLHPC